MNRTGVVKDGRYLEHVMDPGHPESPERLRAIYQMLEEEEMRGRPWEGEASTRYPRGTRNGPLSCLYRSYRINCR
jgi:acetoin utilization deacetylase AcuC-like enzyme